MTEFTSPTLRACTLYTFLTSSKSTNSNPSALNSAPDPDDLLDQSFTDLNGEFVLKGSTSEDWNIEPVLKISHDCADEGKVGRGTGGDSEAVLCLPISCQFS